MNVTEPSKNRRRVAGGAATGGGINFQAAVSAIACVYMARGKQLSWLEKVVEDTPVAVYAETGGAGDDIQLLLKSGKIVEAQVKKGLRSGRKLWDSLTKLANAIKVGTIDYGVLIVSPTSSNTITEQFTNDIIRLGDGRFDSLSQIATQLIAKLKALDLPVTESCRCIRIHTINALAANQADILAARSELSHLCADQKQVIAAWNSLYKDASYLIEHRGGRDVSTVLRLLSAEGVVLSENKSNIPMLLLEKLTRWTFATHAYFTIFGINKKLRTDEALIPRRAVVQDETQIKSQSLSEAINNYQTWEGRAIDTDAATINPETLARFFTSTILIGGPGMGKTTLLKKIARRYSEDFIPILHVRLNTVASRMRAGSCFEEAVFDLGLDGSGISSSAAKQAAFPNWFLLCDGLDECGKMQEDVAAGVARFSAGHPDCRVLITTRPVGYDTAHFSDWRHYYLAPLERSSAPAHLRTLVYEGAIEGTSFQDNTYSLCSAELEREETRKVIARSPLLLGLAASIILRGGHLGATKERLFGQIFEIIDEVPNSRIPEPPAPAAFLQRFLDILGWYITANPLSHIDNTLMLCSEVLARETGSTLLRTQADVEVFLRYWQDVGMIEKIGHGYEKILVFIHKSFGEFAAARHLCSMTSDEQYAAITFIVDTLEWVEVIRFGAQIGLSHIISGILISSEATGPKRIKQISLAIELVATATPYPERTIRERIISETFKVISSKRRLQALEVGEQLVAAARRFPKEVGHLASKLLNHEQTWTYLIGWATALAAGPDYYLLDKLAGSMRICIDSAVPDMRSSLGGGLIVGGIGEHDLLQTFILDSASVLLEKIPTNQTDEIVLNALNSANLSTMGFLERAQKLLKSKGKTELAKRLNDKFDWPPMPNFEAYDKARSIAYESIFEALGLPAKIADDCRNPGILLHLSAFLEASRFGKVPASDVWAWTRPFDKVATQETLKGFIGISGLDREVLLSEAKRARDYLSTSWKTGASGGLYEITTDVDPPEINWSLASTIELDTAKIETTLYHPSKWIVWLAANLIENLVHPPELELTVRRLFENGTGYTLWAACGLAAELTQKQTVELSLDRLSKPHVRGCEYLFELLQQCDLQWEVDLTGLLCRGLKGSAEIAVEAARLIDRIARSGQDDLATIIEKSLIYWIENEEPYPTESGIIPPSPRAKLLNALMKIRPLSYSELSSYSTDPRSDVNNVASDKLTEWLRLPDGP
jgi:NACHT domain